MAGSWDLKPNYDTAPIGTVIQSPINLETLTKGKWIALDGRDCNRSDYPELSPYFPAGVFTSTVRTLNTTPYAATICADSVNFLANGDNSGIPFQASPDGITWTPASGWAPGDVPCCLAKIGSRFVITGIGTDLGIPWVINTGVSAATLAAKANWTQCTGGVAFTGALSPAVAYSPSLGRTVFCKGSSLATASALFYMNDSGGGITITACSGGSTTTRQGVCWTGQKFIVLTTVSVGNNIIQVSSDGATFSDQYLPGVFASSYSIASNGNGTVVIAVVERVEGSVAYFDGFLVSKDHGATWRRVPYASAGTFYGSILSVQYVNGKFIGLTQPTFGQGSLISNDGLNWLFEPTGSRGIGNIHAAAVEYKEGTYAFITSATTTAYTSTEDMSKFRLSAVVPETGAATLAFSAGLAMLPTYMKARS